MMRLCRYPEQARQVRERHTRMRVGLDSAGFELRRVIEAGGISDIVEAWRR